MGQTLGMGVSLIFGFIPTDVVFARIIPSSGWKFSISARVKAWPPTLSARSLALSAVTKRLKLSPNNIEPQKTIQIKISILLHKRKYKRLLQFSLLACCNASTLTKCSVGNYHSCSLFFSTISE